MHFVIETSPGDFLDKLTILEIKDERITDPAQLENVRHELGLLRRRWNEAAIDRPGLVALVAELKTVNQSLWDIEDRIRECEAARRFDTGFIELARAVYHTNDRRAAIKRRINQVLGSALIEEKSYPRYGGRAS